MFSWKKSSLMALVFHYSFACVKYSISAFSLIRVKSKTNYHKLQRYLFKLLPFIMVLPFKTRFSFPPDLECIIFAWFNTSSFMRLLYLHNVLPSLLQLRADRKVLYPIDVLMLSYDTSSLPPSSPAKLWTRTALHSFVVENNSFTPSEAIVAC